jgi:pimeloyl-ACP methyl ester carboxylesterase
MEKASRIDHMGFLKFVKLQVLLGRLAWGASRTRSDPSVVEHQEWSPSGTGMVIYQHLHRKLATCVAVHGVTINGGQDPRLIHFARTMAHFGITCVVPTLGGLASCRLETSDLDELADVVTLTAHAIHQPIGLVGFSFGGSYALIVAGRSEALENIPWVITFGAYHDLADVLEGYALNLKRKPQTTAEWDEAIYQRLAFLYGQREAVAFSQKVWQEAEALLKRYCFEASFAEKRRFYDDYLRDLDPEVFKRLPESEVLKNLSPAGNLEHLDCPVTLIHDRNDHAVPAAQAERILSELETLHSNKNHRLVLTSLLSHVSASNLLNIPEMIRLANALSPLIP